MESSKKEIVSNYQGNAEISEKPLVEGDVYEGGDNEEEEVVETGEMEKDDLDNEDEFGFEQVSPVQIKKSLDLLLAKTSDEIDLADKKVRTDLFEEWH